MRRRAPFSKIRLFWPSLMVLPAEKSIKSAKNTLLGTPSIQNYSEYAAFSILGRNDPLSKNLGTIVPTLPATESQCRALAPLPAEEQREVWQEVNELYPPEDITSQKIKDVVRDCQRRDVQGLLPRAMGDGAQLH